MSKWTVRILSGPVHEKKLRATVRVSEQVKLGTLRRHAPEKFGSDILLDQGDRIYRGCLLRTGKRNSGGGQLKTVFVYIFDASPGSGKFYKITPPSGLGSVSAAKKLVGKILEAGEYHPSMYEEFVSKVEDEQNDGNA